MVMSNFHIETVRKGIIIIYICEAHTLSERLGHYFQLLFTLTHKRFISICWTLNNKAATTNMKLYIFYYALETASNNTRATAEPNNIKKKKNE